MGCLKFHEHCHKSLAANWIRPPWGNSCIVPNRYGSATKMHLKPYFHTIYFHLQLGTPFILPGFFEKANLSLDKLPDAPKPHPRRFVSASSKQRSSERAPGGDLGLSASGLGASEFASDGAPNGGPGTHPPKYLYNVYIYIYVLFNTYIYMYNIYIYTLMTYNDNIYIYTYINQYRV